MPADARRLAEEAIELAGKATPGPWEYDPPDDCVIGPADCLAAPVLFDCFDASATDGTLIAHAGTHYATIARALIEALDRADQYQRDWYDSKSEFGDAMAKARATIREVTTDRDAVLADLPHAIYHCDCRQYVNALGSDIWPEPHRAAIARLEGLLTTRNGDRMTACGELREAGDG